jgi:hypothetical protein
VSASLIHPPKDKRDCRAMFLRVTVLFMETIRLMSVVLLLSGVRGLSWRSLNRL